MIYRETGDSSGESYVEIIYGNLSSLSTLDVSKPTKVLIHGWLDTAFNNAESALRTGKRNYVQISLKIQGFNCHIRSLKHVHKNFLFRFVYLTLKHYVQSYKHCKCVLSCVPADIIYLTGCCVLS